MAGGNNPPPPPPPPSSSASINRQSRWENNNNNNNINNSPSDPNNNKNKNHPKPTNNPNPNPNPNLSSLGPPPPPAYGFHMLERRTIILADGTVRSYLALPPDYHHSAAKRKYHDSLDIDLARQRDHLLRTANLNLNLHNTNTNTNPPSLALALALAAGPSNHRDSSASGEMMRPNKQSRVAPSAAVAVAVDHVKLKKAFLHYAKLINENATLKKTLLADGKQGRLHCAACSRSAKEFPNMHALIMHTYNTDNADLRVDHLGLHKALCVLMGWNFSKPPDNSKAYQFLSADEAAANQDDLIMWPPLVIIHNTNTGKSRDGRMEGLGNKNMDSRIRELGFTGGKSKSLYGRDGHLGITLIKFAGDQSGLKEAMQLAEHLEKESHGRKDWIRLQSLTIGKDDENNPNLVKVDEEKGEKRRILYGYLGTVFDLDKVDFDTRKKVAIESRREYKPSM